MFKNKLSDIVISMSEVVVLAKECGLKMETTDDLKAILWTMGLDIYHERGYEVTRPLHRNSYGDVVKCQRFWGRERADDDYLLLKEAV